MSEEIEVINQYERDDGTVVIEYENGDTEEKFLNGDVKISNPNGLEVYDSADGKTYYVKFPDGTGFGGNSDESIWIINAETGTETYASPDEFKHKDKKGILLTFKSDGTKTAETPDGIKYKGSPDGSEKLYVPDEGIYEITPSGVEHYKFPDGNERWVHSDGRTVYFIADEKQYITCTGPRWTHSWQIVTELTKREVKKMLGF